ncbi:MAG: FHA domain-containing protein [Burkholderiaceae bacterium]
MGTLFDPRTGERVVLHAEHVFGRNALRADTALDDPGISLMHAVARWRDGRWMLSDHSRNGTFVDGQVLVPGEPFPLAVGAEVRLGRGTGVAWRVQDVDAPVDALVPPDSREPVIVLAPHNLLPSSEAPELCVYQARPGLWMLEHNGETRALKDGDRVQVGAAGLHRFVAAAAMDDTQVSEVADEPEAPWLVMRLSLDEEHACLELRDGATRTDLGERSHHYCLATLARRRMADRERGLEPGAQGWLSSAELSRMLGMETTHLNMQIFRAREQLMTALPGAAALSRLVERRRGELRIGDLPFEIYRGDRLECRYRPNGPG